MNSRLLETIQELQLPDPWDAFAELCAVPPVGKGGLSGYRYAVKDVFHVKGYRNRAGNPDWLRTSQAANEHSEAIQLLQKNGAFMLGLTHTDELMFSLNGENAHYGTPTNPAAPNRIPGGSSSGSAVITAAGAVDFALGTDTGGSVRVPAAYCGIFGFRPTHDAVSLAGVIPLAPSFDTVGWFAKDMHVLDKVGRVLLGASSYADKPCHADDSIHAKDNNAIPVNSFNHAYFPIEAWSLVNPLCQEQLQQKAEALVAGVGATSSIHISEQGLVPWMEAFRVLQGIEIWKTHGKWIQQEKPSFGPGIAERFAWTSTLTEEVALPHRQLREQVRNRLTELLGEDGILVIPTTPDIAPLLGEAGMKLEERRLQTLQLTSIAGLCGLPQLAIPAGKLACAPLSVSIIAGPGQDRKLLQFARQQLQQ